METHKIVEQLLQERTPDNIKIFICEETTIDGVCKKKIRAQSCINSSLSWGMNLDLFYWDDKILADTISLFLEITEHVFKDEFCVDGECQI